MGVATAGDAAEGVRPGTASGVSVRRRHLLGATALAVAAPLAVRPGAARAAAPVDSYAAFWKAFQQDDADALRDLLARGMDPNTVDERGEPALIVALRNDQPRLADLLVRHPGLKVDQRNALGESALMLAVYRRRDDLVRTLIARGAQVDHDGWTPLHYAADVGDAALAELLVARGARVDARSPNGTTPLMMAARNGESATVRWLLAKGADRAAKNQLGMTAQDFAARAGFTSLGQALAPAAR